MGKSGANERNESSLSNCRVQPALSKKEGRVDFRKTSSQEGDRGVKKQRISHNSLVITKYNRTFVAILAIKMYDHGK